MTTYRIISYFILWIAGIDLGVCLGNLAAGEVKLPQAWLGAFVLSVCALAIITAAMTLRPRQNP